MSIFQQIETAQKVAIFQDVLPYGLVGDPDRPTIRYTFIIDGETQVLAGRGKELKVMIEPIGVYLREFFEQSQIPEPTRGLLWVRKQSSD